MGHSRRTTGLRLGHVSSKLTSYDRRSSRSIRYGRGTGLVLRRWSHVPPSVVGRQAQVQKPLEPTRQGGAIERAVR